MKHSKKRITLKKFKQEAFNKKGVKKLYLADEKRWVEYRANNLVVSELGVLDE